MNSTSSDRVESYLRDADSVRFKRMVDYNVVKADARAHSSPLSDGWDNWDSRLL